MRLLVALLAVLLTAPAVRAQEVSTDEVRLLEAAAEAESDGLLERSEARLMEVLELRSGSVPALLALERVLRIQGRLAELVPHAERALEQDPASPLLNQLRVRTLAALDRPEALEAAAEAWIEATPGIEVPYREISRVWVERGAHRHALGVLEAGRGAIGSPDALALELGDLYEDLGDRERAAEEWARAIDRQGRGLSQVRRRLRSLPHGGLGVVETLVDRLATAGEPGRVDAALRLAVEARLERRALELTEARLRAMDAPQRRGRLERLARRADAAGLSELALWSYARLLALEGNGGQSSRRAALQARVAELQLLRGDTLAAARGFQAVEDAFPAGSPQRRQAAAARVELLTGQAPEAAAEALGEFREAYPEARERDQLTAAVAEALVEGGATNRAARLVADAPGPRATLVRARLLLAGGDVPAGRTALLAAAPGLRGPDATEVLSLVTLLGRITEEAGMKVGQALAREKAEGPGAALDRITAALDDLPAEDRPPLLAFAADRADAAGLESDARQLRRRLVADHPRSTEAPGALLALGRALMADIGTGEEAREVLERLIIEYPRSALVPQAREVLDRLNEEDAT